MLKHENRICGLLLQPLIVTDCARVRACMKQETKDVQQQFHNRMRCDVRDECVHDVAVYYLAPNTIGPGNEQGLFFMPLKNMLGIPFEEVLYSMPLDQYFEVIGIIAVPHKKLQKRIASLRNHTTGKHIGKQAQNEMD